MHLSCDDEFRVSRYIFSTNLISKSIYIEGPIKRKGENEGNLIFFWQESSQNTYISSTQDKEMKTLVSIAGNQDLQLPTKLACFKLP